MLDAWHAGTGSKLWSFSAEGLISTNIAVARGAVYFGSSDDHVYAVSSPSQAGSGGSYSLLLRLLLPAWLGSPVSEVSFRPNGPWYPPHARDGWQAAHGRLPRCLTHKKNP